MANRSAAGFGKVMSVTCLPASSAPAPAPMRPAGDIALNHSLQLLARGREAAFRCAWTDGRPALTKGLPMPGEDDPSREVRPDHAVDIFRGNYLQVDRI